MIIYINDDQAYLAWLEAHPRGFVVNAHRVPRARYLMLHSARCGDVSAARRGHWTSGPYIKACSVHAEELAEWAQSTVGGALRPCPRCQPSFHPVADAAAPAETAGHPHLTRLGEHLLSHILELAVMSLDGMASYVESPPTIGKLAPYFGKTLGQLRPVLRRLVEDGYVSIDQETSPDVPLTAKRIVYPTIAALRSVPAFQALSEAELSAAVASLRPGERCPGERFPGEQQRGEP